MKEIIEKAIAKLKEEHGEDFKFENGDEFVFSLQDCTMIISKEDDGLKFKFLCDPVIPLDMCLGFEEGAE